MTNTSGSDLDARTLHPGDAEGTLLVLDAPLSFWGGVDDAGVIVDAAHPQRGLPTAGRVLALPATKGSSSSTSVLTELIRAGNGPAAVLLGRVEPIIVLGVLVAAELYGVTVPAVVVEPESFQQMPRRGYARVSAGADAAAVRLTSA